MEQLKHLTGLKQKIIAFYSELNHEIKLYFGSHTLVSAKNGMF